MTGVVQDASGAFVPNVKVTATNTNTNLSREAITDASGTYRIPALNPGPYRLEAQAAGFKTAAVNGLVLEVAQQVRVDVQLQVGELCQSVEVTERGVGQYRESAHRGRDQRIESRSSAFERAQLHGVDDATAGINEGVGCSCHRE